MNQYRVFITAFFLSTIAMVILVISYINGIVNLMRIVSHYKGNVPPDPFLFLKTVFSPLMLMALLVLILAGLLYRVLGIIFIARNTQLVGGEQALWIVGFAVLGFVTAIVFLVMAQSRRLLVATGGDLPPHVNP